MATAPKERTESGDFGTVTTSADGKTATFVVPLDGDGLRWSASGKSVIYAATPGGKGTVPGTDFTFNLSVYRAVPKASGASKPLPATTLKAV